MVNSNECWLKCINKKEAIPAKMINVFDDTDENIVANLNSVIYYKQPQIYINDKRLFENRREPPSSDNQIIKISNNQIRNIR